MATGYKPNSQFQESWVVLMEPSTRSSSKKPMSLPSPAIDAVEEDLLREILLRLPNMASLLNATLACKRWRRAAASDPAVLQRFLPLRRPPLVGFILTDRGNSPVPHRRPYLSFVGATASRPNLASAAAGCDVFFDHLPAIDPDDDDDEWCLRGCDGSRLLLSRRRADLAVYDPIARTAVFFHPPQFFVEMCVDLRYALVVDHDDEFRVIGKDGDTAAAVFSSRTGKWASSDFHARQAPYHFTHTDGVHAGRKEQNIQLWSATTTTMVVVDGCSRRKEVSLLDQFVYLKKLRREWMKRVRVLGAKAGYVYMEFWSIRKPNS
uniref:F-box domain-containing protein n=1 Tax=Leersia perrieri TaxID=77586 RepID=A0A0D9XIK8_9ORYZ